MKKLTNISRVLPLACSISFITASAQDLPTSDAPEAEATLTQIEDAKKPKKNPDEEPKKQPAKGKKPENKPQQKPAEKKQEEKKEDPAPTKPKAKPTPKKQSPATQPAPTPPPAPVNELTKKISQLETEKRILELINSISDARKKQEFLEREEIVEEQKIRIIELETAQKLAEAEAAADSHEELAALKQESARLVLENTIAKTKMEQLSSENKLTESGLMAEINALKLEMQKKEQIAEAALYTAEYAPVYLDDPLEGRTLTISDRRIEMNGTVMSSTADHVTERIHYFNNKDKELPIFIVIEDSPGGSVMAGYRILKAMEGSDAPVYVVVKSFAASMAACITTLAERSFAYPNAILLHHQIAGIGFGNLSEQRENVEDLEEWWKRLADPVAEKLGMTRDEFIEKMYANDVSGDWEEFADEAQKLKWVDHIIDEIRETAIVRNPDFPKVVRSSSPPSPQRTGEFNADHSSLQIREDGLIEQLDEKGRPFVRLPRINPRDVYWMFNPDDYFRSW